MNLVIVMLFLVLLAAVAAFGAYLILGFDQALLPSILLAFTVVLVLLVLLGLLRGRDPFARLALRLIRQRFPRSVGAERTRLVGALAVSMVSAPATKVGEGAATLGELVRRRLYLVHTSTSLHSKSLELWRWRSCSIAPAVVFDLSQLRECKLIDHDPDRLRSETPEMTMVLDLVGAPEPIVLWVRKGQHAGHYTRRINEQLKRRAAHDGRRKRPAATGEHRDVTDPTATE